MPPMRDGTKIFDEVVNDGTDVTVYSERFSTSRSDIWSLHLEWDETVATYATTIELYASNKIDPDPTVDADWVQMVAGHGWDGFTGGNPSGGDGSDFVDVGISGALWYHVRAVRTGGTATLNCWLNRKGRQR